MCKRHYKEEQSALAKAQAGESHGDGRQQDGENGNGDAGAASPKKVRTVKSVYDHILPNSIRWNPLRSGPPAAATTPSTATDAAAATTHHPQGGTDHAQHDLDGAAAGEGTAKSATSAAAATAAAAAALGRYDEVMPLVSYLRKGRKKPYGWHRRDERIAMAANPVHVKSQMEPWERRLVRFCARLCSRERVLRSLLS